MRFVCQCTVNNGSTNEYSRRLDDFGRAVTDLPPTQDSDREGATKASPQAKAANRDVRTVATRMLLLLLENADVAADMPMLSS